MNIYLLRHGEAGQSQNTANDWQRPLTLDGVARMERQAATLAHWKIEIDAIVSSPWPRAHQTASAVAEALHLTVIDDERLAADHFNLDKMAELIEQYGYATHLMLTGHSDMELSGLVGGGAFKMEKGGLACVKLDSPYPPRGTLLWLLTPEIMGA